MLIITGGTAFTFKKTLEGVKVCPFYALFLPTLTRLLNLTDQQLPF
jgi:hypothetical protein